MTTWVLATRSRGKLAELAPILAGEVLGHGGKSPGGRGRAHFPGRAGGRLGAGCPGAATRHAVEAQAGIVGAGDMRRAAFRFGERPLHVGLSGGEPEVAEKEVVVGASPPVFGQGK